MADGLAPVAVKLGKLLPMLASNHDGEVVAAARAIARTLQGAGLDFHALVGALGAEPAPAHRPAPAAPPAPLGWWAMATAILEHEAGRLSTRERDFVESLTRQCAPIGRHPTEKQMRWLRALHYRVGSEFVR